MYISVQNCNRFDIHTVCWCQQPLTFRDLTHEYHGTFINDVLFPCGKFKIMYLLVILLIYILKSRCILAHMLMKSPPPRGYKNNPVYPAIDYDLNGPLPSLVTSSKSNYQFIIKFICSQCVKESLLEQLYKPGKPVKLLTSNLKAQPSTVG